MGAELLCLAMAIYYEARSESLFGQIAVAQVAINRVESPRYPDSLCEVLTQGGTERHRCQFSFWCDGKPENPKDQRAWRRARVAATLAQQHALDTGIGDATHYHATYVDVYWRNHLKYVGTIGQHSFYSLNRD